MPQIHFMKIYTKAGDAGMTSILGGDRLSKHDIRIEAYGTVDELNAFLGNLHDSSTHAELRNRLSTVQSQLFTIGSILATSPEYDQSNLVVKESWIESLELWIDEMEEDLEPLRNFILPSGHPQVSASHICRTICRRAERRVVALTEVADVDGLLIKYLNRLSDYFFVLARWLAAKNEVDEIKWSPS